MKKLMLLVMIAIIGIVATGCMCTGKGKCCGTCKKVEAAKCAKCPDGACKCK